MIEFIRPGSELDEAISRVLLKEVEKHKYKPRAIVAEVQKKFPSFTMNDHTQLWKSANAKDPKKNFGCSLSDGQWYWYETWLAHVLEHLDKTRGQDRVNNNSVQSYRLSLDGTRTKEEHEE